jgi:hypothetical protein
MRIQNGIIFIWSGTHASIPSGWERVLDMDDKYPKGSANATNPNVTGGATTHTHTVSGSHNHTISAHTHTVSLANGAGGGQGTGNGSSSAQLTHAHANFTSGAVASASVGSSTPSYAACSNDPEHHTVIYVTPETSVSVLPEGIISLADGEIDGMNICNGTEGTPNLADKFLKGASTGANAGTTGGSKQNVHALSHTHTTSHAHSASTSPTVTSLTANQQNTSTVAVENHSHSVTLSATAPGTTDNVSLTTLETDIEPAFTKLLAVQAPSDLTVPLQIIAMWLGALVSIPRGWTLCDGNGNTIDMRERHLKITATVGDVGGTGGSNTHTHAAQNHSHTEAHTHTASNATHSATKDTVGSSPNVSSYSTTYHAVSTNSVNLVTSDASTSAEESNNEPAHRTVAFIKLISASNPKFLFNFIY